MKKILLALAAVATIFAGCSKGLEDRVSNLENRVSEIEALLTELDVRVKGINTIVSDLQKNVYVTDVKPVEENGDVIGYTLTFTEGEPVTIYHGVKGDKGEPGDKGETLTIDWFDADGEGPEDGDWYWKDKEGWLTDDQDNKIPAVKPLDFEIKEGVLWVTVGNVEEELGSVHGDSWFEDVDVDNEAGTVTIVIPGASQNLVLPFNPAAADGFALNLNLPASTEVILGGTINISYTLAGCDAKDAAVFVQAPEDWIVAVDEAAQKIALTVGEKAGRVVIYAVNNVTGEVRAKFVAYNPETMLIFGIEKSAFYLLSDGSNSIKIPVSTGLKYRVEKSDWLTVAEAPATKDMTMTHKVYTVTAGENTTENTREGEVTFWKSDGSKLLYTVTVLQKGYNPALLFDGEGNPIQWQETFSLKKGSDIKNFKNDDVTIELSDDPAKGTYKIKNMFEADNYNVQGAQAATGIGADYYADVNGTEMTVYVTDATKTPNRSYYFDNEVTLTIDHENMTLTSAGDITAKIAYLTQPSVTISGYTVEIPAPAQEGGALSVFTGTWTQKFKGSMYPGGYASSMNNEFKIEEVDGKLYFQKMFTYQSGPYSTYPGEYYGTLSADGKTITLEDFSKDGHTLWGPMSENTPNPIVLNVADNTLTIASAYSGCVVEYVATKKN